MSKSIFIVFLLLSFGCECQKEEKCVSKNFKSGFVLTFDDDYTKEWLSITNILKKYNTKATFFVSNFHNLNNTEINNLKKLKNLGHEIGHHSTNHLDAIDFVDDHNIKDYIEKEIVSSTKLMKKNDLSPISFAYPYGLNNRETDSALFDHFIMLRDVYDGQRHFYSIHDMDDDDFYFTGCNKQNIVAGLGIDKNFDIEIDEIKKGFERVLKKQEIIIFYAHKPVYSNPGNYEIGIDYLESVLNLAQQMGLASYRFCDLAQLKPK